MDREQLHQHEHFAVAQLQDIESEQQETTFAIDRLLERQAFLSSQQEKWEARRDDIRQQLGAVALVVPDQRPHLQLVMGYGQET